MRDPMSENPRVADNDAGEIVVTFEGRQLRSWTYAADTARRSKMRQAREYVEGWIAGRDDAVKGR